FKIFNRFLDKKHSYIDLGSWIGSTVLYGSQLSKYCYAIDSDAIAMNILNHNLKLNPKIKNKVKTFEICISNKKGYEFLGNNRRGFGDSTSSIFLEDNKHKIKCISFKKFLEKEKITNCNFIKIDVEGAEIKILQNIKQYLKKEKPTIHLSLHPWLFKNLNKDSTKILDSINSYRNIFTNKGKKISQKEFVSKINKGKGFDVVIADKNWA
ncbi:MAG: FkbM family methyltransferase, partial [Nanoarchaeota archaeon]|nr:FkbM family methyltransferase [Nanoarchaeota archaeon]